MVGADADSFSLVGVEGKAIMEEPAFELVIIVDAMIKIKTS